MYFAPECNYKPRPSLPGNDNDIRKQTEILNLLYSTY